MSTETPTRYDVECSITWLTKPHTAVVTLILGPSDAAHAQGDGYFYPGHPVRYACSLLVGADGEHWLEAMPDFAHAGGHYLPIVHGWEDSDLRKHAREAMVADRHATYTPEKVKRVRDATWASARQIIEALLRFDGDEAAAIKAIPDRRPGD